jgi:hypothetical protein
MSDQSDRVLDVFEQYVCPSCEEESDDYVWANLEEADLCAGCHESDLENASTIYRVRSGEAEWVRYGTHTGYNQDGDEPDEWFTNIVKNNGSPRQWIKTDGWRGHYDSSKNLDLVSIASGWTTGWVDETTNRKVDFNEFGEQLIKGEIDCPFTIFILVEPTSNVFSTAVDLLVREADKDRVLNWLEEAGYGVSTLQNALS